MEAASRGARSRLGVTVGILPGDEPAEANGWVELALPTGLGETRNAVLVRSARGLVAIGRRQRHALRDRIRAQARAARRRARLLGRSKASSPRTSARERSRANHRARDANRRQLTRHRRAGQPPRVRSYGRAHARARSTRCSPTRRSAAAVLFFGLRWLRHDADAGTALRARAGTERRAGHRARTPRPRTVVHVAGAVRRPGVYSFAAGARVATHCAAPAAPRAAATRTRSTSRRSSPTASR